MERVFCFVCQKSELGVLSNSVLLENASFCTVPADIVNAAVSQARCLLPSLKLIKLFKSFVVMRE